MSFSITNYSATAVLTDISTPSSTYGTFTITSGSFPLFSGNTISGTNTRIDNLKGSKYGTMQLFLQQGNAQIEVYVNGNLISGEDYSSGLASIQIPILLSSDTLTIYIDESDLPAPTLTPSNTATPTSTPTPSVTPTMTLTPTPSSTPVVVDPATLNAIWWLDYSNSTNVSLSTNNVIGVKNLGSGPDFTGLTPYNTYYSTAFNGVSGATGTQNGLSSLSGDYMTNISAYTHFFHFSAGTGDNGAVALSETGQSDYSGNTQGYRWFSTDDYGGGDFIRTYSFYVGGASTNPEPQISYVANTWTAGAVRVYMSGTSAVTETWVSSTLSGQTIQGSQTIIDAVQPIFKVASNGGSGFKISEQFFFDYKLSDAQMSEMFTYLSNKY